MNCPVCNQAMKKIRWTVTNNQKTADEFKEYDPTTYQCEADDAWANIELPVKTKESGTPIF